VWHLDDEAVNEGNVVGAHLDSTVNGNHADQFGNYSKAGKIGVCQEFGTTLGENDFAEISPLPASEAPSVTLSCWFKSYNAGSIGDNWVAQRCVTQRRLADQSRFAVGINNNKPAVYWHDGAGNKAEGTTVIEADVWYHAAVTYDGIIVRLYLNGELQTTQLAGTLSAPFDSSDTPGLGGFVIAGGPDQVDRTLDGDIDEVRISKIPRSAAWLRASYLNQNAPSSFYAVGTPGSF
jgi:hypothetical protein